MNINIRRETFIKWYDTWKVVEWKMLFDWAELLLLGRGFVLLLLLSRSVKLYIFYLVVCARHEGNFTPREIYNNNDYQPRQYTNFS